MDVLGHTMLELDVWGSFDNSTPETNIELQPKQTGPKNNFIKRRQTRTQADADELLSLQPLPID
eukprot:scaffold20969_cov77-Skeletonema_dohrnii-CCMP3373.AAC.4